MDSMSRWRRRQPGWKLPLDRAEHGLLPLSGRRTWLLLMMRWPRSSLVGMFGVTRQHGVDDRLETVFELLRPGSGVHLALAEADVALGLAGVVLRGATPRVGMRREHKGRNDILMRCGGRRLHGGRQVNLGQVDKPRGGGGRRRHCGPAVGVRGRRCLLRTGPLVLVVLVVLLVGRGRGGIHLAYLHRCAEGRRR